MKKINESLSLSRLVRESWRDLSHDDLVKVNKLNHFDWDLQDKGGEAYKKFARLINPIYNNAKNTDEGWTSVAQHDPESFKRAIQVMLNIKKEFNLEENSKSIEKDVEKDDVDQAQLKRGIEIEYEHTDDWKLAEKIALDHLAEIPDYYTRLDNMEKQADAEGKKNEMPDFQNNKFKNYLSEVKTLKQIFESLKWTDHKRSNYSIEASDLGQAGSGRNICPNCDKPFSKTDLVQTILQNQGTEDEETAGWKFKHNCGAILTVWND